MPETTILKVKPSIAVRIVRAMIRANKSVLLVGGPGIGKTAIATQACEAEGLTEFGTDYLVEYLSDSDPTDVKGICIVDPKSRMPEWRVAGQLRKLLEDKRRVVILDEFGSSSSPTTQAAYRHLVLARELEGRKISDKVSFIAATNRVEDQSGVSGLLEMAKSGFHVVINLDVDASDWLDWAVGAGIDNRVVGYVRLFPDCLTDWKPERAIVSQCQPRTLEFASDVLASDLDPEAMRLAILSTIGERRGQQLMALLALVESMPDLDACINNGATFAWTLDPHDPNYIGLGSAIAVGLGYRMDPARLSRVAPLVKLLPPDYQILAWSVALKRHVAQAAVLMQSTEWIEHRTANQAAYK